MTAEQLTQVAMYLSRLRDGDDYDFDDKGKKRYFTQSWHHRDALAGLVAALRPQTAQMENDEEIIRRNLLIWSQPSCP
jgi:hypothetical protein